MSTETQTDDTAQHRFVQYPSRDGSEQGPLVRFPGPSELSEEDFGRATNAAWPQLLQEFVGNNYPPEHDHGYVDELVRQVIEGDMKSAQQRAQAWRDARRKWFAASRVESIVRN